MVLWSPLPWALLAALCAALPPLAADATPVGCSVDVPNSEGLIKGAQNTAVGGTTAFTVSCADAVAADEDECNYASNTTYATCQAFTTAPTCANGGSQCSSATTFTSCNGGQATVRSCPAGTMCFPAGQNGIVCDTACNPPPSYPPVTCAGVTTYAWTIPDQPQCNVVDRDCVMSQWASCGPCSASCGGGLMPELRYVKVLSCGNGAQCSAQRNRDVPCNTDLCGNPCVLADWADSGSCNATCGSGIKTQTRSVLTPASGDYPPCPTCGDEVERTVPCDGLPVCPVDCVLGPWQNATGPAGVCSKQCGGGTLHQTRPILVEPVGTGAACDLVEQDVPCNEQDCPVPCIADWVDDGCCGATCGDGKGQQNQVYHITQAATGDYPACPFEDGATRSVDCKETLPACPVDCVLSPWYDVGTCSKECGGGTLHQTRDIITQPQGTGLACDPVRERDVPCNSNACNVDCEMNEWTNVGECSRTCGGGVVTQTRTVKTPKQGNGCACPLINVRVVACNTQSCADCVPNYGEWSTCSKKCGGGTQTRKALSIKSPCKGGASCPNIGSTQTRECNTQTCPVDCVTGPWQEGSCSTSCGFGLQTMTRAVLTPASNGGCGCGALTKLALCFKNNCLPPPSKVDCVPVYSPWSTCSKTCGGGKQTRTVLSIKTPACNGGLACPAIGSTQTQSCNTKACNTDCVMSAWSAWSTCSKSCGGGLSVQTRMVVTPASGCGQACGPTSASKPCNTQSCSTDCQLGPWVDGTCSVTCGVGVQTQTRAIITPRTGFGCACGALTRQITCTRPACPRVDCQANYGPWSTCSKTCGGGKQMRTVTSIKTPACNGGAACPRIGSSQVQDCNTQSCPNTDCVVGPWVDGACSVSCGTGLQTQRRVVLTAPTGRGCSCPALTRTIVCTKPACPRGRDDC